MTEGGRLWCSDGDGASGVRVGDGVESTLVRRLAGNRGPLQTRSVRLAKHSGDGGQCLGHRGTTELHTGREKWKSHS